MVEQCPDERLIHRLEDGAHLRVPACKRGECVRGVPAVCPGLACPRVLLDDSHEVNQAATAHEVVHKVSAGSHPDLGRDLEPEFAQPFGGHQAPVRHAPGEPGILRPEQRPAHQRADAVGAHEHIDLGACTVREQRLDVIAVVYQAGEAVTEMQPAGRHLSRERRQQIGAMHLVMRRAERGFEWLSER